MNKPRLIATVLENLVKNSKKEFDIEYSDVLVETCRRFIRKLPDNFINPEIHRAYTDEPEGTIGFVFSYNFVASYICIAENKIWVEKLDEDHWVAVRETWFDFNVDDEIPTCIIDFFKEHFQISEQYLVSKRRDFAIRKKIQDEIDRETKDMNPIEKMGYLLARPLRHELLYSSNVRELVTIEEIEGDIKDADF